MTDTAPTPSSAIPVPPGWYRDPVTLGLERWYDGRGWTAISRVPTSPQVVVNTSRGHKTSHGFHLMMTLLTLGLWLPVWVCVGIYNASRP